MAKPSISIIMAAKNREKLIAESIENYLQQTFKDWELIIVDDHSTDETLSIAQKYQSKDSRIKVFSLPGDTGVSPARDHGIKQASSDIIAIGDSDDLAREDRLEKIILTFKNFKCDSFYSGCYLLYEETGQKILRPFQPFNPELLKAINFIPNSASAFLKTAYFAVGGYDKNFKISEDYDLWLKFLEKGYSFYSLEDPLATIRIHQNNLRSENRDKHKEVLKQIRQIHHLPQPNKDEIQKLVAKEYWKYLSTPKGLDLWF